MAVQSYSWHSTVIPPKKIYAYSFDNVWHIYTRAHILHYAFAYFSVHNQFWYDLSRMWFAIMEISHWLYKINRERKSETDGGNKERKGSVYTLCTINNLNNSM